MENYTEMFRDPATLKAIRNTTIWVVVAPLLLTGLGLILAVLTEKIRWATAFKLVLFMPMAISFLAAGIIFRVVYEQDPDRGVLNAVAVGVHDTFEESAGYPTARPQRTPPCWPRTRAARTRRRTRRRRATTRSTSAWSASRPRTCPRTPSPRARASKATAGGGELRGVVWVDFTLGGGGKPGQVDPKEKGLPRLALEAVDADGKTVAETTTAADGSYRFRDLAAGDYAVRLPAKNFAEPYGGVEWLGPTLITPAIIGAYLWIWTGFALVLIGAGLSAMPRDVIEAAKIDGANEWQIFRRITVPLLAPVLGVVFVTQVINVMKVFDLVYIIAPGPVQQDANVLALQMWLVSFGGGNNQGLGSALGVLLLLLVVPAMILNIRRFRRSNS